MQSTEKSEMDEGLEIEGLDFDVMMATLKAIETKSITPIVKEELKLKIQASRLAAGKKELPKPVFKEPEKYQLTAEEEGKRQIKRERNRIAAEKCRKKKKNTKDNGVKELEGLRQTNRELKTKVAEIEREKSEVVRKLMEAGLNAHMLPIKPEPSSPLSNILPSPSAEQQSLTTDESPSPVYFHQQLPDLNELSPLFTTPSVPATVSGYTDMSPLPQSTTTHFRRSSNDVINHVVTPEVPPYYATTSDPYMTFPSTSTAWPDMPERFCEGIEQPDTANYNDFSDKWMCLGEDDVAGLQHDSCEFAKIEDVDQELDMLMAEEEEALVPGGHHYNNGRGHHLNNVMESPSFY